MALKKTSPKYRITAESLSAYMAKNKFADTAIIGEDDDKYYTQRGNKIEPLSKKAVEEFSLNHGFIEGMGFNGLSAQEQGTFINNKRGNTVEQREKSAYESTFKDENLQAYRDQTKEHRREKAVEDAYRKVYGESEPQEGVHWKGNKSYPKGGGTNQ